jgi:hypothetical protein
VLWLLIPAALIIAAAAAWWAFLRLTGIGIPAELVEGAEGVRFRDWLTGNPKWIMFGREPNGDHCVVVAGALNCRRLRKQWHLSASADRDEVRRIASPKAPKQTEKS